MSFLIDLNFVGHLAVGVCSSSHFNYTSHYQLVYFFSHGLVLHDFLDGFWISLHSLQHNLDHGIHHDCLYLWILHCILSSHVVISWPGVGSYLNSHHCFLLGSLDFSIFRIDLQSLVISFHGLVVFLQKVVAISLAKISFHEFWIKLNTCLCIFKCLVHHHKLDIGGTPVWVECHRLWISSKTFIIFFNCTREVSFFEKFISFLPVFFCFYRIKICLGLCIFFDLFCLVKCHFDDMTLVL